MPVRLAPRCASDSVPCPGPTTMSLVTEAGMPATTGGRSAATTDWEDLDDRRHAGFAANRAPASGPDPVVQRRLHHPGEGPDRHRATGFGGHSADRVDRGGHPGGHGVVCA